MKYWIGLHVRSNKVALLDALEAKIPSRIDSQLWDTSQYDLTRNVDGEGVGFVSASVFFNDFAAREDFKLLMGKLKDHIEDILPISFIRASKCWHDELLENGCPMKTDELVYEEVID